MDVKAMRDELYREHEQLLETAEMISQALYEARAIHMKTQGLSEMGYLHLRIRTRPGPHALGIRAEWRESRPVRMRNGKFRHHMYDIRAGKNGNYTEKNLAKLKLTEWELEFFLKNEGRLAAIRNRSKALTKLAIGLANYYKMKQTDVV